MCFEGEAASQILCERGHSQLLKTAARLTNGIGTMLTEKVKAFGKQVIAYMYMQCARLFLVDNVNVSVYRL